MVSSGRFPMGSIPQATGREARLARRLARLDYCVYRDDERVWEIRVSAGETPTWSEAVSCRYFAFSSSSVIITNQALPSLQSPARVKDSPLLSCLTVLLTGLPLPISFTSTLGPSSSVISTVHLSLMA